MSGAVFISHSSKDRAVSAGIRSELEAAGLPCWISSRDVAPGANFAEEIVRAISEACAMVLIFSRNADQSAEIQKEIALADQKGVVVIPLRVEDVSPTGAMQYQLAARQWIDWFADKAGGMERLVRHVQHFRALMEPEPEPEPPPPPPKQEPESPRAQEAAAPETAAPASQGAPATNLPFETNNFIGREDELEEMSACLADRRCLTLVGPGGVGKSRLALRLARSAPQAYPDGVWLVELAPLADAALVAEAVCRVISVPISNGRSALEVAVAFLRAKKVLLILDSCEHLRAAVADLTHALLVQCPGVSVLATSREPLKLNGERVFQVPTLPVPGVGEVRTAEEAQNFASMMLFVQRANDAGGYRLSNKDAPDVARICRRLDGLPMAIELAAARMTVLKAADIANRLEKAFGLLNIASKTALPGHQTLWATLNWSHSLLSPEEQILFRRLSVFVDGFSLEGATEAAEGDGLEPDAVLDLLEMLVDKSLVRTDMSGERARFRMLEATRHYAREKLKDAGETWRDQLAARYLVRLFQRAEEEWPTTPTVDWLAEFAPEAENLRASIDWAFGQSGKYHAVSGETGDPALGVELVACSGSLAEELSLQLDMRRWTAAALAELSPETPPSQAGWIYFWSSKWGSEFGARTVTTARRQAIDLFRAARDKRGLSTALGIAAIAMARPGEPQPEVAAMLDEAVRLLRPLPPTKDLATALARTGTMHLLNGDPATARRFHTEAQAIRRKLGDRSGLLTSALNFAELQFITGQQREAIAFARAAAEQAKAASNVALHASLLTNIAAYLLATDRVEEAAAAACEGLTLNRTLGNEDWAVLCMEHLALAHALSGAHHQAARLFGFTDGHYRRTEQTRDPLEQAGADRLREILAAHLSEDSITALMMEGEFWDDDYATTMAQRPPEEAHEAVAAE